MKKVRRVKVFGVRLSMKEFQAIKKLADSKKLTPGTLARIILMEAAAA
jgi:hypothetical protein